MNKEEQKEMDLLKQAIKMYEQEVAAKDELIQGQKKVIAEQEKFIQDLQGMFKKILKP